MTYESKVTSKGQITIPKELRERYNIKVGDRVVLIPEDDGILIKHRVSSLASLRGLFKKEIDLKKADSFIKELRRRWRIEALHS